MSRRSERNRRGEVALEEPFHLLCKTNNTCEESGKTRARYKALTAGATELTNVAGECAKDDGEGVH